MRVDAFTRPDVADDHEACTLHRRDEIVAILDRLLSQRALATVEFGDGHAMISSLLELRRESGAMIFDIAHEPMQNRRLFAATRLSWVTELDQVEIAFETCAPTLIALKDGPAAVVPLPRRLTRLQRREWYRVELPDEPPIRCTVLDSSGNASPATVIDLSCGGAALVLDGDAASLGPSGSDHELILALPDLGRIEVDVKLRNAAPESGAGPRVRAGFRFEKLSARTESQLQRYVQRAEVNRLRRKR